MSSVLAEQINVPTDYATLQAAVAAANHGDEILLDSGTYVLGTTLQVNKEITIEGTDRAGVVINAAGTGLGWGINVNANNVTLRNFTVLPPVGPGARGTSQGGGFAIHGSYDVPNKLAHSNLTLQDITIDDSNRTAFDIHGFDGVTLSGLVATDSAYGNGIQLSGCTNVSISNCTTSGNAWGGIAVYASKSADLNRPSSGISFDFASNNIAEYFYVEKEQGLGSTATVTGNSYQIDNAYNAPTASMSFYTDGDAAKATALAQALNTKYSNKSSVLSDASGDTVVLPGLSIQAAINAATAGETVNVGAGVYNEDIVINKSIALIGAGAASTEIRGTKGDASTKTVEITSNNVELAGFTITRDGNNAADWNNDNGTLNNEGLSIAFFSGLNLHDNRFTGNRNGVLLYSTTNSTVRNNVITDNRTGLHMVNMTSGLVVEENEITNNWTVGALFREELTPSGATDSVFRNNNISGNWYGQVVDIHSGAPGSKPKSFAGNWFGTATPSVTSDASGEPGYAAQIPVAFGGSAVAPTGKPEIAGASSANIEFQSYYLTSGIDTNAETETGRGTYGFQGALPAAGPVSIQETGIEYPSLQAAVTAATAGQTIVLGAGSHGGAPVNVNKAVTIKGPNAGIPGTGVRGAEARITNSNLVITAAGVVIDGVEIFRNDAAAVDAVQVQAASEVKNSVFRRNGATAGVFARAITTSFATGITITGNLFTGDASGGFFSGHKTWNSGVYSNGGSATISGNTFENCRSSINLDDFNAGITVTGNSFLSSGTYVSFGGVSPTAGSYTIAGNNFAIDFSNPTSLPSTLFNNSNVATTFRIDATGNTFGGVATAALTDSQKFALEARMYHRGRGNRNGVIDFSADQQVVVAGTTIASAIAAANTGDSVLVGPGTFSEDVVVNKSVVFQGSGAGVTTLSGPIGGGGATVSIAASDVTVDGFTITRAGNNTTDWNNPNLNTGGVTVQGQALSGAVISNNEIVGNRTGIDVNNSNGHSIRNNVVANNRTGLIFRNQTDNLTVEENSITGNWTAGIVFLDASSGNNSPLQQAVGSSFTNNDLSGNWYGAVVDRQSGGSLPAAGTLKKNFESNWFGSATPVVSTANSAEPGYAAQIPVAFGGTAEAPEGPQPDLAGSASANLDFAPLLASGTDTDVETVEGRGTYGFQGSDATVDVVIGDTTVETPQTYENLFIPAGTIVTVPPASSLTVGNLNLGEGSTLVVEEGSLTIGDSVISGSFTIFNSFGSFNIDNDTTFTVGQSLALVTDIHVADGKTITVNGGGEFILDGCVINCQTEGGTYDIDVATNGLLTIARSVVTGANIDIDTVSASVATNLKSKVYDNSFIGSDIEASADAAVYHNLFDAATDAAANSDESDAFADVDGWSNVTDAADLQNRFALNFAAPANATRTLDAEGNLFVQPADPVVLKVDVGNLSPNTIVGADALLGYNSNRLSLTSTTPAVTAGAGWQVLVDDDSVVAPFGLIDSGLGLDFTGPGDDGISGPSTIANVNFTAGSPGLSLGFFRVQTNRQFDGLGELVKDTRLIKSSGGATSYLRPFTENTGELVIDNEIPTVNVLSVTGLQDQDSAQAPVNVLSPANRVFRTGDAVTISFNATDAGLAGLDAADAANDLVFTANNGTTVLGSEDYSLAASEDTGTGIVTYTVTLNVPATATTGTYALSASVLDRSGNSSGATSLGSFIIANEANVTVELQGFTGSSRNVVFKATNASGQVLATWTKTLNGISGSTGSVNLDNVPAGTVAISAKTAWTLRSKKAAVFSTEGVSSVALTGTTHKLKGGDLNGDNVVNTLDYGILRYHFNSDEFATRIVADITGDAESEVNLTDFNVMQANFYTVGSAE